MLLCFDLDRLPLMDHERAQPIGSRTFPSVDSEAFFFQDYRWRQLQVFCS